MISLRTIDRPINTSGPLLSILMVFKFLTHVCNCFVKTELIGRNNSAKNGLNCWIISSKMYRQFSVSFALSSLPIGRSRIKVDVLSSWSLPRTLVRPSASGKIKFPFSSRDITSLPSLFEWMSDASIVSNSSRSATNMSPFRIHPVYKVYPSNNPGKTFFPNWWTLDWSFAEIRQHTTSEPNGMIGSLNGFPKRLSFGVFPQDKRSWMFRRQVQHSMESAHQFSSRPDCKNTAEVPSFHLGTALSSIPFVSDRCGVDVQWFQEKSSQALPNSKELSA